MGQFAQPDRRDTERHADADRAYAEHLEDLDISAQRRRRIEHLASDGFRRREFGDLRAERFQRTGGRRRVESMDRMMMPPPLSNPYNERDLLVKFIAVGAASGIVTGLLGVLVGYLLFAR